MASVPWTTTAPRDLGSREGVPEDARDVEDLVEPEMGGRDESPVHRLDVRDGVKARGAGEDGRAIEGRGCGARGRVHQHADGAAGEHDHHARSVGGLRHVASGSSGRRTGLDGPWTGL